VWEDRREAPCRGPFRRRSVKGVRCEEDYSSENVGPQKNEAAANVLDIARAFIMHTTDLQRDVLIFFYKHRASVRPKSAATRAVPLSQFNRVTLLSRRTCLRVEVRSRRFQLPLFFTVSKSPRNAVRYEHSSDAPRAFCAQSFFLHNFRYLG